MTLRPGDDLHTVGNGVLTPELFPQMFTADDVDHLGTLISILQAGAIRSVNLRTLGITVPRASS